MKVTKQMLMAEMFRVFPVTQQTPLGKRPSLSLDDQEGAVWTCTVSVGRAEVSASSSGRARTRRELLEMLQTLAPADRPAAPQRVRDPGCRNERCRWLSGAYCPFCAPHCPHGNPYDSPHACAVCENST